MGKDTWEKCFVQELFSKLKAKEVEEVMKEVKALMMEMRSRRALAVGVNIYIKGRWMESKEK